MTRKDSNGSGKDVQPTEAIGELELSLMNSRGREWLLRHWDFPLFQSMMVRRRIHLHNACVLEAGCGSGYSTLMISEMFQPQWLDAFDIEPGQIERAKGRQLAARFFAADVTDTGLSPRSYEAVFACGVLHHCPEWRAGLAELARLLKYGGLLFLEEPTRPFVRFESLIIGRTPANEAWSGFREVRKEIAQVGLGIAEERALYFGLFRSVMCVKMTERQDFEAAVSPLLARSEEDELAHRQGVPA